MNKLFQPTYLKEYCQKYGLVPSKQYGQHYLISEKPIQKIIEAGELKQTDTIVEIGPGFGVLTLAVAPLVRKVVAFEIEKKLEPYWEEKQKEFPNVEIVWGNALQKFQDTSSKIQTYKVLANLPYQITSDAIRTILEAEHKPELVVLMVQKEVAERIVSDKGDMNMLALSVQYYGKPRIVCNVSSGLFWPMPKVDSAVIAIDIKTREHKTIKTDDEVFFRIARAGFSNKRKQLWNNLSHGLNLDEKKVKNALLEIAGNEKIRAEDLSADEWQKLAKLIHPIHSL